MMKKQFSLLMACGLCISQPLFAGSAPNDHAPIGVMGEHTHKTGEWMVSYRYGYIKMDGNRTGTHLTSPDDVLSNYRVTPLKMTMQMHMFGAMYGVSDRFTVMAMLPLVKISMDHQTRMGMKFTTQSNGVGDVSFAGLYSLYKEDSRQVILKAGFSLPTGSINRTGTTPMGSNQQLPYPMQIGSGTYNMELGLTLNRHEENWSWGSQFSSRIRLGTNDRGYRLGHLYKVNFWGARKINDYFSLSARVEGQTIGNIKGSDSVLNPMMVPTARTDLRSGQRIDVIAGVNFIMPSGALKGHRLAVEFAAPVYQDLDGPQLETDYKLTVGWQLAF